MAESPETYHQAGLSWGTATSTPHEDRDMLWGSARRDSGVGVAHVGMPASGGRGPCGGGSHTATVLWMREVAEGVFEIRILFVHAHLVVVDDGVVLVDTGLPGRSARIEQALREARTTIGKIRTILLTHWHADHTGNAAELRRRTGARIVAHALDAAVISGATPLPLSTLQRLSARLTGEACTLRASL